jgi:hypothetical protein
MIIEYKKIKEELYDEIYEDIYSDIYKDYNIVALLLKPMLIENGVYKIIYIEKYCFENLNGIRHYINKKNHNNELILKIKKVIEHLGAIECKTQFEGLQIDESAIILQYIKTKNNKFIFNPRLLTRID